VTPKVTPSDAARDPEDVAIEKAFASGVDLWD
jgi:hypothetical protein